MSRIKVSDNFYLDEFIHPDIYKRFGAYSMRYIDANLVNIAQLIRTLSGKPTTINNWYNNSGHKYIDSGLRNFYKNKYGKWSVHLFGKAIDVKVQDMTPGQVWRNIILQNLDQFKAIGLTTIEDLNYTPTWIHLSTEWTNQEEIRIVKP